MEVSHCMNDYAVMQLDVVNARGQLGVYHTRNPHTINHAFDQLIDRLCEQTQDAFTAYSWDEVAYQLCISQPKEQLATYQRQPTILAPQDAPISLRPLS